MKNFTLVSFLIIFSSISHAQSNNPCDSLPQICLNDSIVFNYDISIYADTLNPSNDYGCLSTTVCPHWFYFLASDSGYVQLRIKAETDADFIVYGPFNNKSEIMANCNNLGSIDYPIMNCSYSAAADEPFELVVDDGKYYCMLITNYAGIPNGMKFTKIWGDGDLACLDFVGVNAINEQEEIIIKSIGFNQFELINNGLDQDPVLIYNTNGQIVHQTNGNFLDLNHLSPGIYIVHKNNYSEKVIVN